MLNITIDYLQYASISTPQPYSKSLSRLTVRWSSSMPSPSQSHYSGSQSGRTSRYLLRLKVNNPSPGHMVSRHAASVTRSLFRLTVVSMQFRWFNSLDRLDVFIPSSIEMAAFEKASVVSHNPVSPSDGLLR